MCWYKTKCKRMYNYRIQTNDLMHTILLIRPLCYKHESTSVTVCFCMLHIHVCQHCCSVLPCSWCRTSCAGPATTPMQAMGRRPAGPGPLMDSKISQKHRLATKQGSEQQTRNCRAAARRRPYQYIQVYTSI